IGAALAIPFVSEVFRVAYYASLVPNTALAKEAGAADWSQGLRYLANFVSPYALFVPIVLLVFASAVLLRRVRHDRATVAIVAAPLAGAVVHALYVVRLGGDFMHARLLLPAMFALALPCAVVQVRRGVALSAALGLALVWAVVCGVELRPPR